MRAVISVLAAGVLVLTGCAAPDAPDTPGDDPAAGELAVPGGAAWRHVGHVEAMPPGRETALVADRAEDLAGMLSATGAVDPVEVDFDTELVLLLLQPDDACPDRLVGLDAVDGTLEPVWLAPPGGCDQPLIWRLHTVVVHRGHLQGPVTVVVPEPFRDEVETVTIDFGTFDGQVPPPPSAPSAMTDEELAAVFDGHPVQRCEPLPESPDQPPRGELDGDPVGERIDRVMTWLTAHPDWDTERELVPIIDIWGDGEFHIRVAADRADALRADLEAEFGPDVAIVDGVDPSPLELAAAQDTLGPLHGGDGPGAIVWSSGAGRRLQVEVGMVDPTREALDRIAELVDPRLVCVEPQLSGVPSDG